MKFIWRNNKQLEAGALLFGCSCLARSFFQNTGYFVLPSVLKTVYKKSVFIPDLAYSKIPLFWEKVGIKEYDVPAYDRLLSDPLIKLIPENLFLNSNEIDGCKKEWGEIEEQFVEKLIDFFPSVLNDIRKVIILPTRFDTVGSYHLDVKEKELFVHIRIDVHPSYICFLVILAIVHHLVYPKEHNEALMVENEKWFEKQSMAYFIIMYTSFLELIKNFPIMSSAPMDICKVSEKYLDKLGFEKKIKLILKKSVPYLEGKNKYLTNITRSEKKILSLMIKNKNKIVTFESIAQTLWEAKVNDKYSLYAITKLISEIRKKLVLNGVYKNIIKAHKGEGYELVE